MATRTGEGWKGSGLLKDPGIPAPSGQYRVGCVDLMEGDDKGGLLVRLHYPTEASPGAKFSYTPWLPHRSYIKGYLSSGPSSFTGIVSWILNGLLCTCVFVYLHACMHACMCVSMHVHVCACMYVYILVSLKPHPWIHSTGCITSPAHRERYRVWYTCHTRLVLVECFWSPMLS